MKDDVNTPPILLGFPGRMVGGGERLDHYTTKVGGAPDWPKGTSSFSATSAAAAAAAANAGAKPDPTALNEEADAPAAADKLQRQQQSQQHQPQPPPSEMTSCGKCGAVMALVVQAHAPLTNGELPGGAMVTDRTLYLMTCFNPSCPGAGQNAGRWRAIRAQRPPAAAAAVVVAVTGEVQKHHQRHMVDANFDASEGAQVGDATTMMMATTGDDWGAGAGGDDWGAGAGADDWGAEVGTYDWGASPTVPPAGDEKSGAMGEEDVSSGSGDWGLGASQGVDAEMDELSNALDALATTQATATASTRDNKNGSKGGNGGRGGRGKAGRGGGGEEEMYHPADPGDGEDVSSFVTSSKSKWRGPLLPEFYIIADWEPDPTTGSAMTAAENANAERLLAQYAAAEGIASASDSTSVAAAAAAAAAAVTAATTGGGAEWSGEGYEKGIVEGLDKCYLKFSKRMRRAPEQCMRYAFGGGALCWPADGPNPEKRAPTCPRCAAPRRCELQLMPPLLHFASEGLEWSGSDVGGRRGMVSVAQLDAWDWQTVGVFTCSKSCSGDGGGVEAVGVEWTEEAVETVEGDGGIAELLRANLPIAPLPAAAVMSE